MSAVQPYLGAGFEPTEFGGDCEFWETPRDAAELIRPMLDSALRRRLDEYGGLARWSILEPSAGRGALVEFALTLQHTNLRLKRADGSFAGGQPFKGFHPRSVTAIELDVRRAAECAERFYGRATVVRADAFSVDWNVVAPDGGPRLALGNPPFSLAVEFVERSLEWAGASNDGCVAMMLQTDFATGVERCEAIHEKYKGSFYPLKRRPAFGGSGKSGKRPFAWFIWDLAFPENEWMPIG